jgi:hypothetical protein
MNKSFAGFCGATSVASAGPHHDQYAWYSRQVAMAITAETVFGSTVVELMISSADVGHCSGA